MINLYKVLKTKIRAKPEDIQKLYDYNRECGEVWNDCLDICKQHYEKTGKWLSKYDLQKIFKKRKYNIPAKVIQQVLYKYVNARTAILEARKVGRNDVKFPYRKKKYFNSIFDYQSIKVDYENKYILLASPLTPEGKKQPRIKIYIKNIPQNIKQIEIVYNNGLYACITYLDKTNYPQIKGDNIAAIDLGEIHAIASIDNNGNAICISGRKLRSIKYFRNKKYAELQSKMSKCRKGSRQYKKYNKVLQYIRYKAKNQIIDTLHKISKFYVDFVVENNISAVFIGDVEGVQRNTKNKTPGLINQKLSQWEFGKLTWYLEYKLKQYGIKLIKVKEYYSSQKCPNCGQLNKPKGRNYKCKYCGLELHRDIVGAINILQDNSQVEFKRIPSNIKYLRIV